MGEERAKHRKLLEQQKQNRKGVQPAQRPISPSKQNDDGHLPLSNNIAPLSPPKSPAIVGAAAEFSLDTVIISNEDNDILKALEQEREKHRVLQEKQRRLTSAAIVSKTVGFKDLHVDRNETPSSTLKGMFPSVESPSDSNDHNVLSNEIDSPGIEGQIEVLRTEPKEDVTIDTIYDGSVAVKEMNEPFDMISPLFERPAGNKLRAHTNKSLEGLTFSKISDISMEGLQNSTINDISLNLSGDSGNKLSPGKYIEHHESSAVPPPPPLPQYASEKKVSAAMFQRVTNRSQLRGDN